MKLYKSLLTLSMGLAMAACSNDALDEGQDPDGSKFDGQAYMSLSLSMPNGKTATRADNPGTAAGSSEEQAVNSAYVLTFNDAEDPVCLDVIELGENAYQLGTGVLSSPKEAVQVHPDTKKILVVLNPAKTFRDKFIPKTSWGSLNSALNLSINDITTKNEAGKFTNFMMINEGSKDDGALVDANIFVVDGKADGIPDSQAAKDKAMATPTVVNVDRLAAKVTMKVAISELPEGVTCNINKWALDVTNKVMYPYSEITLSNGGNQTVDYRIDPNFSWSASGFNVDEFNYLALTDEKMLPADFQDPGTDAYCLENTMDGGDTKNNTAQQYGQTTAVTFSATYFPSGFDTNKSWFCVNNTFYDSFDKVLDRYKGDYPNFTTACDQFLKRLKAQNPDNADLKSIESFDNLTSDILEGITAAGEASRPQEGDNVNIFFDYYQKGACYYYSFIKHDNEILENFKTGKYGVVRNNWYTATVTSVLHGPGTPYLPNHNDDKTPVDLDAAYIGVDIVVNDWTAWNYNIDL